ncbi:hypothetical protein CHARACLAT_025530 [Characodon lateralis]|uniref:Uncharacterized protein n=1 Tax=Characodon lateralis TaxID=208331 RepID=A0ABU7F828_9TELE|nr:hypothetical protein [Characodon lateralis]
MLAASLFLRLQDPDISTPCFFLLLEHWPLSSFFLAPSSQQKRQLDNSPSQVKTLNLSSPGGSCYNNLLVWVKSIPKMTVTVNC